MNDWARAMIAKHRVSGVVIDTNLLLLWIIGHLDRAEISRFKRTRIFSPEDFDTLHGVLSSFRRLIVTPHVLAETSNLLGNERGSATHEVLTSQVGALVEVHKPVTQLCEERFVFVTFGVADTALLLLAKEGLLVLTEDAKLDHLISIRRLDSLNFNQLRSLS
jgi:hypothetical protein